MSSSSVLQGLSEKLQQLCTFSVLSFGNSRDCFFDELAGRLTHGCFLNLLTCNQSPINRLSRRLTNEVRLYGPVFNKINYRSQRPSVFISGATLDIAFCELTVMEYENAGNLAIMPEIDRNGHTKFGWIKIRQLMEADCRLMAVNALDLFFSVL
jgi:hypothetical protein